MTFDWIELAVVGLGLALGGLLKGVTGVGLPLIAVPVMAGFLGVEKAVLIMIIPSFVLNLVQVLAHRNERNAVPELPRMLIGGALGALSGASILAMASDTALALALAVWLLIYVAFRMLHPHFALSAWTRRFASPLVGAGAGAMQAATGISAPIVVPYMDSLRLQPSQYVYAVCVPFCAFALAHGVIFAFAGGYAADLNLLWQSLIAVVPAVIFVPIGTWIRGYLRPERFDLIVRLTVVVMAIRLLFTVFDG